MAFGERFSAFSASCDQQVRPENARKPATQRAASLAESMARMRTGGARRIRTLSQQTGYSVHRILIYAHRDSAFFTIYTTARHDMPSDDTAHARCGATHEFSLTAGGRLDVTEPLGIRVCRSPLSQTALARLP
jgi:hypothetical protein